jgi:hypothetical protein
MSRPLPADRTARTALCVQLIPGPPRNRRSEIVRRDDVRLDAERRLLGEGLWQSRSVQRARLSVRQSLVQVAPRVPSALGDEKQNHAADGYGYGSQELPIDTFAFEKLKAQSSVTSG